MTDSEPPQLSTYALDGQVIDQIDLKALVISRGVRVAGRVYRTLRESARLSVDPLTCSTMLLPDRTAVQLTDLSFHMSYVRSAISWDIVRQLRHLKDLRTPFSLDLDDEGEPVLYHNAAPVTKVHFPPPTDFYDRSTASGLPFRGNAVLQGTEWLSFQCLWPCAYAAAGSPCQYCYSGGVVAERARGGAALPKAVSAKDAAEIVAYAVTDAKIARSVQITGGSTMNTAAEFDLIRSYIDAMSEKLCGRLPGELLVYATVPDRAEFADQVFAAGADRLSCSMEIWDERLARRVMPGKARFGSRDRHLETITAIAERHGPGTVCSNFIVGLEPLESCLEGARELGARGIVPIASVWIPFGRPVEGSMRAPDLSYYRAIKDGFAEIYTKYGLEPPGGTGLNVCMDREIYLLRNLLTR